MSQNESLYQVVTDQILQKLKEGTVPWRKPWAGGGLPTNLITQKPYGGLNAFFLDLSGHSTNYWATRKQIESIGGSNIKTGENPTNIVFSKMCEKPEQGKFQIGKQESPWFLFVKYFEVFNLDQTEGLEDLGYPSQDFNPISKCEEIVKHYANKPSIQNKRDQAYYQPSTDKIKVPHPESFDPQQEYYSTLFHELVHSTGHPSRLNRKSISDIQPFGSHQYSKEELVAEIGCSFLCAISGIETKVLDNSVAYIADWFEVLKENKGMFIQATMQAQKSVNYIIERKGFN